MKPLISVNLLLYKPKFYLKPCLDSIFAQTYENFELLIMDNDSGDGTVERVKEIIEQAQKEGRKIPFYKIIANKENLGFAGGHNLGINESRGELVAMINQDVILDEDFLKQAAQAFDGAKGIGSAQAKILRLKIDDGSLIKTDIIDTTGLVILKNRRIIARGQGRQDGGQYDKPEEVFGVDGAIPVYRRETLKNAGITLNGKTEYFDEDFFAYKEDVDLAWRMRLYGWKVIYAPQIIAWHARTSGDSEARNYLAIVKERLKIGEFAKYLSFKNQRLMQIKNEQAPLLLKDIFYWLPKEIASWIFVILLERYSWRAIRELFEQAPLALQKRKMIMSRKKISNQEMSKWFK
ncbi:MAG: glycosyltransferase family 2 protein [Candidatus Portnoybacteria bacterium]|nr:glycosyltransferase family 2 protein [Candidatus Portnoybacteria bacterium]MDD4983083.1 glycosyltransferase family 2 protein [Candidatus Portnoybacteria bacterium]